MDEAEATRKNRWGGVRRWLTSHQLNQRIVRYLSTLHQRAMVPVEARKASRQSRISSVACVSVGLPLLYSPAFISHVESVDLIGWTLDDNTEICLSVIADMQLLVVVEKAAFQGIRIKKTISEYQE